MNSPISLRAFVNMRRIPTVVLVDMQQEYLAKPRLLAISNIELALDNCRALLAYARQVGLPVAFVRWHDRSAYFNRTTRFSRWIEGFEPQRSEMIFERSMPSCYSSNDFAQFVDGGDGGIVLAGFAGESACLSTILDAFHRNHRVTYLFDASASHDLTDLPAADVHRAVAKIVELYGDVWETDEWIKAGIHKNVLGGEYEKRS